MPGMSLNIDATLITRIEDEAKKTGHSNSFIVNFHLRNAYNKIDQAAKAAEEPSKKNIRIHCEKCGADYSSKLNSCPGCADQEITSEEKQKEAELDNLRQEISSRKAMRLGMIDAQEKAEKNLAAVRAECQALSADEWEQYGREKQRLAQTVYDKATRGIVDIDAEIKALKATLQEKRCDKT